MSAGLTRQVMPELIVFLLQVVVISLSGVMAPGPVTAATLAAGTRARHAGSLIAVGHGIVEFPLMLLIIAGAGTLLASSIVMTCIGILGGAVLVVTGGFIFRSLQESRNLAAKPTRRGPIWTGIVLTGGNPYFIVWWVTIGLTLASRALQLGALAFVMFAVVHWLCDLVWLEALSLAGFNGTRLLGDRVQKVVLGSCSIALIGLGFYYMLDAARLL